MNINRTPRQKERYAIKFYIKLLGWDLASKACICFWDRVEDVFFTGWKEKK